MSLRPLKVGGWVVPVKSFEWAFKVIQAGGLFVPVYSFKQAVQLEMVGGLLYILTHPTRSHTHQPTT